MKAKLLLFLLVVTILLSGCAKTYSGPYADTKLLTKDAVVKQIELDKKLVVDKKATLLKQVQAKSDVKYYQMILASYELYEGNIKNSDSKQYTIVASAINKFIKDGKYTSDLKKIESDQSKWPSLFLGNLARYFNSLGFSVHVDRTNKEENIVINW